MSVRKRKERHIVRRKKGIQVGNFLLDFLPKNFDRSEDLLHQI